MTRVHRLYVRIPAPPPVVGSRWTVPTLHSKFVRIAQVAAETGEVQRLTSITAWERPARRPATAAEIAAIMAVPLWIDRHVIDAGRLRQLLVTYLACKAADRPVEPVMRALGWSATTANRLRDLAIKQIVDGLNRDVVPPGALDVG